MKLSENWLRQWVNPDCSSKVLVEKITMAGLEVDACEPVADLFSGVVVAEIKTVEAHPDAEKLRVCSVDCGTAEPVQVVCGASNARPGLKVPFAAVGAVLPGDFAIKEAKLRGVASFGMLCGASELGMEDQLEGLMELPEDAPPGVDLRDYLGLDDQLIDIDLTPNRGDCLSVMGLSREVAVLSSKPVTAPDLAEVSAVIKDEVSVVIEAPADCPAYAGRVIRGIDNTRPSPLWLQERLRRSGVRSIDAVVDVTNYVMLELGQPMHAFDRAKLAGGIVVRRAGAAETLQLLDGKQLLLEPSSLVIADHERALALAGIMGGENSGVDQNTCDIVLESAFFAPQLLAGRARAYGLHTDSSHRFERGVDWQGQRRAIERASSLLLDIVGGEPGPINYQVTNHLPSQQTVFLQQKRLQQVLGLELEPSLVSQILQGLGFAVISESNGWQCQVPSWRFDITIEADLIEEIARIYGYNKLPVRELTVPVSFRPRSEVKRPLTVARRQLVAAGYQEAITYSFIEPGLQALFSDDQVIEVANPISSDMAVMRSSLLPGLVGAMQHNRHRQQPRVRLFESGLCFRQSGQGIEQFGNIAGVICGSRQQELWANDQSVVDFYDIKGDVEGLLAVCGQIDAEFVPFRHKAFHPGQSAAINVGGEALGLMGALHPQLTKKLAIAGSVFAFELSLHKLLRGNVPGFKALSKFPQVRRDLSLLIDATITANQLVQQVKSGAGSLLQGCFVFDVYQGKGIEQGKKSVAMALVFQHLERSLQDDEIQAIIDRVVITLKTQSGASLRM